MLLSWQLALHIFRLTKHARPPPAGTQWEKGGQMFQQMRAQGCMPDVVTYTALISAYERGGQWQLALEVRGCGALCMGAGMPAPMCVWW